MEREEARQAWAAWIRDNVGGEHARQEHALQAALQALERGAGTNDVIGVARQAAADWPGWSAVTAPLPPPYQAAAPIPAPVQAPPVSNPGLLDDKRIVAALAVALSLLLILGGVAAYTIQQGPAEAAKSADGIFADGRAALAILGSYHAHATSSGTTLDLYYQSAGAVRQELVDGTRLVKMIEADGNLYVNGNAAFYGREPVLALHAADQWITAKANPAVLDSTASSPQTGAECMFDHHGRLTRRGLETINGRRVVEVDDAGDRSGSTPARYFFAVDDGPMDMLRVIVTGPTHPGAFVDRCINGLGIQSRTNRKGERIDFTEQNGSLDVTAPANAISLNDSPFCGDAFNFDLPGEIQQYMATVYDRNVVAAKVEAECGCPSPTLASLRLAYSDDAAGEQAYLDGVQKMTLPTVDQRAARARLLPAVQAVIRAERSAIATSQYSSLAVAQAWDNESIAAGQFRSALGLPQSTCSYSRP